jgi:hypothetical protein
VRREGSVSQAHLPKFLHGWRRPCWGSFYSLLAVWPLLNVFVLSKLRGLARRYRRRGERQERENSL